jgi:hypothetical protein
MECRCTLWRVVTFSRLNKATFLRWNGLSDISGEIWPKTTYKTRGGPCFERGGRRGGIKSNGKKVCILNSLELALKRGLEIY